MVTEKEELTLNEGDTFSCSAIGGPICSRQQSEAYLN